MFINFLYQGIYQILILILPLITIPYTSRVLGAEGIGLYSYSYAVVSYFVSFANMGINIYGNREIAAVQNDKDKRSQLFCDLFTVQIIFASIALLAYIIMIGIGAWDNRVIFLIQGIYILGQACDINWLYFGLEKFKITIIRNLVIKAITTILVFLFIKEPTDLIFYLLILAIGTVVGNSAVWLFAKQYIEYKKPILVNIKQYIKPIVILLIPSFAVKLYTQMDKVFIEYFCGLSEVGYYENSEKIINITFVVITALSTVMLPRMANLKAENKKEEFNNLFQKAISTVAWMTIGLMFGIIGISDNFVLLYLGKDFLPCIVLVIVLAITIPFKGCAEIVRRGYIIPQKRDYIYVISVFSGAGVNIIINLLLIPDYGTVGAAIGTVMAELTVFFIQIWKIRKDIDISKYIRNERIYIGIGMLMFFCIRGVKCYTSNFPLIILVLLQVLAGISSYLVGTFFLKLWRFRKVYLTKSGLKMRVKNLRDKYIKKYIMLSRKNKLRKNDKRICALHKEWEKLSKNELKLVREDKYAYKIFKNIFGGNLQYFVSDVLYQNEILPKLNFANYTKDGRYHTGQDYFADKNYQDFFIKNLYPLKCVVHNVNGIFYNENYQIISKNDTIKLILQYTRLVLKKSIETGHGEDVSLIDVKEFDSILDDKKDYIIQEVLEQHESLAYYNSSSVNVIRITTLFWKGNVYILGGILRIGPPGSFCDHTIYGENSPLIIPLDDNGKLGNKAIDCDTWKIYDNVWGKKIKGYILKYGEMKEKVKNEHLKYPKHGIIGWDLALDKNANIRCIEYNVRCPGIMQSQYALGAIFAQKSVNGNVLLDEILGDL